jgi:Tannase and feruloyl esterase
MQFFIVLGIVSVGLNAAAARAESTLADEASAQCNALQNKDFSEIPDAPTQITEVIVVKASDVIPEYCKVTAYVAPQVGIKLGLPVAWNGKFIEMGCAGHCGTLNDARLSGFFEGCGPALRKGYACIITDMGHKGTVFDTVWAYDNLEGVIDWGYRATHVTALAGKAITQAYYQKPPVHSYFSGISTGGRQALQAAQRFPYDFDGIIAGAPPVRLADIYVTLAWGQRVSRDASGKPILSIADLKLLTNGALARCDLDDGVQDGIISSPFKCPFHASDLACRSGQTAVCLPPEKVKAAEQIYEGPVDSHGMSLFGADPLPGSELGGDAPWNKESGGNWGVSYVGTDKAPAAYSSLAQEGLRFLFFSPPLPKSCTIRDFDFDKDYKRLDVTQSLYDSSNPDRTRFKSAGGRMLIYQGLNDAVVVARLDHKVLRERRAGHGRERENSVVCTSLSVAWQ